MKNGNLKDIIKTPLKYDDMGQTIFDKNNNFIIDIRGWGFFQYYKNGIELQDLLGKRITHILNKNRDYLLTGIEKELTE